MEGLNPGLQGENLKNESASRDDAFEQLKRREKEIERLNEIQTNLAITFFSDEIEIDQCIEKWITSGLSQKFRTLLEDTNIKERLLSSDTKIMDDAYEEVLASLKQQYDNTNTN